MIEGKSDDKIFAWSGFQVGTKPFLVDDIFRELTKEELNNIVWEYVPFSSFDLCRLDRLQAICTNSPTSAGVIQQKVNYFLGDGFYSVPAATMSMLASTKKADNEQQQITEEQENELNELLMKITPEGENIEELTQKIIKDFCCFGNAFIEICKVQVGQTRKFYMRLLPITWCRPKKATKDEMYPTEIGVSSEFEESWDVTPSNVVDIPLFPNFKKINGIEKSIFHLKNYEPTLTYWGTPDWISAKIWAEIEYRIPKFNQSKFENGFTPSAIISLFGSANQEEAQQVVKAMKDCFTGTGNNSKMFIQALRDNTYKSDIQTLNSSYEGEFMSLQTLAQSMIISAHRWTSALTGLRTAGSLGSNQQIRSEFDIVFTTVIRPMQRMYLTKILNPAIQVAAEWLQKDWKNIALDIAKPMPVSFMGDIQVAQVLTPNEQRAELGFAPIEAQPQPTEPTEQQNPT
jgi:capsid portal protein